MICTKRRLNGEIERIKKILLNNGFPKNVINAQIAKKIAQLPNLKRFDLEQCPAYLRVPWIGKPHIKHSLRKVQSYINISVTVTVGT